MKRLLLFISIFLSLFFVLTKAGAQGNQNISNGQQSTAVNFTGAGCTYSWTNDKPGIGLPATGVGNIASFTGINTGTTPITATIIATPAPTGYAYISNNGSNTVSVINTISNTVVTAVPVGKAPFGIAISPDGSKVYVANIVSNTVSVIDAATNTELTQISVGTFPYAIAMSPDGSTIYVANNGSNNVSVISTATNTEIKRITVGNTPYAITISPDGSRVYVANNLSSNVSVINTATLTEIGRITVGRGPEGVVVSPDGKKIYVTNVGAANVSVIDVTNSSLITNISVGSSPEGISISPDGSHVYVANYGSNTVSVINTSTNLVDKTINVGTGPYGLAVSTDGSEVYVANSGSNNVSVIATASNIVTNTVAVGSVPDSQGNFVSPATTCIGSVVTFTITVNPTSATPVITPGLVTGVISACEGTASASPNIQQFTVSGSNLTNDIIARAPANFEVSLTWGGGYGSSVTLPQTGGTVANTVIYIRSAASASIGSISGNVVVSSGTTPQNVAVTGTVNALPTVNGEYNQNVLNGQSTTVESFAGTGNTFTWINDTPGIGLPASGTGNIASFPAVNNGSMPVTATVTVTPMSAPLAYISNSDGTVSIINTLTNMVTGLISIGANTGSSGVAVSPDGKRVYVANTNVGTVSVINTSSNKIISTITVGQLPANIVISPDGSKVYVANSNSNSISVINTATNSVFNISLASSPEGIAISPDGSRVYVTGEDNTVSVINTLTNTIIKNFLVAQQIYDIVVSPDGSKLYVISVLTNLLYIINANTDKITYTVKLGDRPDALTISHDGKLIYISIFSSKQVYAINTVTNKVTAEITVGTSPAGLSITPDDSKVYVANNFSNTVSVINTVDNSVISTISVGSGPEALGNFISPGTGCTGNPATFTFTVNATDPPTITPGPVSGVISACAGTASASPDVEQFNVSGVGLTNDITATAPTGFEVSVALGSGYANTVTLKQTGGTVTNQIIYVRAAASARAGNMMGYIVLNAAGASSQDVMVNGVVSPLPIANAVANQNLPAGSATTAVSFTGTATSYTWTNDSPGIGLPASGTGNISVFTAVNSGTVPVTATITATPQPSPGYAYIDFYGFGTISVYNAETNTVVTNLSVGTNPWGLTVSPDGSKMYVANSGSNSVSVINTATNTVVSTFTNVPNPSGLAISPDGSRLYVTNVRNNTVTVLNTVNGQIVGIAIPVGTQPQSICITPDGSRLYVSNAGGGSISVINTATSTVSTIAVSTPGEVCISPDGSKLYVTNAVTNGTVSVINTATNTITGTIAVGNVPFDMAISPDGGRLYVGNDDDGTVSIINTATGYVLATVKTGLGISGISVTSDGREVYVANQNSNNISVIDAATNAVNTFGTTTLGPGGVGNFISPGSTCSGIPIKFTITVNPSLPLTIKTGPVIGIISACAGTASASPDIEYFAVSGSNLTNDIVATAPAGFEVSLTATSGYSNAVILKQTAGTVTNQIVYVRSAATDAAGNYMANVVLSSTGVASQNVMVNGNVSSLPAVNAIANQSPVSGAATNPVTFTGTANNYTWINDSPLIGLAGSGTGNIASFVPVNNGTTPITATITVTPQPSPGYAFLDSFTSGTVSVVNTETGAAANLTVGIHPEGVAISPDGSKAYVANGGSNSISVIDIATNTVTSTIAGGSSPYGLVISPDGSRIYASDLGDNTVTVINSSTGQIIGTPIFVGSQPEAICISPDGSTVYVVNSTSSAITVINTLLSMVTATISGINSPGKICISHDGEELFVTNQTSPGTVSVINIAQYAITAIITVGKNPLGMAISPDGGRLYVCNLNDNTVSIINTATNAVLATVAVNNGINGIAVSADGSKVYITSSISGMLSVIDAATNTVSSFTAAVGLSSYDNFVSPGSTCSGPTKQFTITVLPDIPAVITTTGSPTSLTTVYGTASLATSFSLSGVNMRGGILVTPPAGFEVSTDGISFSPTVNTGVAGKIGPTTIYIRLAATTAVSSYAGNIVLSSTGATSVNVLMPTGTVTPVPLIITAKEQDKVYGGTLISGPGVTASSTAIGSQTGFTSTGLQNSETIGSITITYGPGSAAGDVVGVYLNSITPSAATGGTFTASNYTITYISAQLNVVQTALSINADNKTKIAGTENPPLTLTYSGFVNSQDATSLTIMPTVNTTATINSPPGEYPITVSGAADPNYTFLYEAGILTVTPYEPTVIVPNTFTPNGDGINDYWDIKYLESYPKCTVDIYNRYGEKLYSSIGYPAPWDGKYKGSYLPSGTYYYIINLKNGSSVLSGFVAIIR